MEKLTKALKERILGLISDSEKDLADAKNLIESLECVDEPPPPPPPPDNPILGVNIGKEYDERRGNHPIVNYIKNLRVFLLLEEVYGGKFPSVSEPIYNPDNLDEFPPTLSMAGYRDRFKQMHNQGFDIRISLESIFEKTPTGDVIRTRPFPNKSFSRAEWGGNATEIIENARKLAVAIDAMYGEFISRLEFTNEAWGEPGFEATKWIIRGMINGFQEVNSDIKLSLGAYQAYKSDNRWKCDTCAYPSGDFIGNVLEDWMLEFIDEITIHPYSFSLNSINLVEQPLNNPNSEFKYLYDMVKWRDENYPNLKLCITEIGWNSAAVGEEKQADYLEQVLAEAGRLGIETVYVYEAVDSPRDAVFSSCGLFEVEPGNRKPTRPKAFLNRLAVEGDSQTPRRMEG